MRQVPEAVMIDLALRVRQVVQGSLQAGLQLSDVQAERSAKLQCHRGDGSNRAQTAMCGLPDIAVCLRRAMQAGAGRRYQIKFNNQAGQHTERRLGTVGGGRYCADNGLRIDRVQHRESKAGCIGGPRDIAR